MVRLYLNPPDQLAVVSRYGREAASPGAGPPQPSLPMTSGRAAPTTHDFRRHGTMHLFAALDVLTHFVASSPVIATTAW